MSLGMGAVQTAQGVAGNLAMRTMLPGGAAFAGQGLLPGGVATSLPAESTPDNPRLVTAAHQFEAAMMQEILGPLTEQMEGKGGLTGDEEDDGGPMQALTSFASEALGEALSQHGGFGIAASVLKKLRTEVARRHAVASVAGTGLGQGPSKIATVGKEDSIRGKTHRE